MAVATTAQVAESCRKERSTFKTNGEQQSPSCVELFRRAFAADQEAWSAVHHTFESLVKNWVGVQNRVEPEEVVQDTFLQFFRYAPKQPSLVATEQLGSLLAYLKQTAKTALLMALRKAKKRDQQVSVDSVAALFVSSNDNTEMDLRISLGERIDALLEDQKERLVFHARFILNIGPKDIYDQYETHFEDYKEVATIIQRLTRRLRKDPIILELKGVRQNEAEVALLAIELLDESGRNSQNEKQAKNMQNNCQYDEVALLDYITGIADAELRAGIEMSAIGLSGNVRISTDESQLSWGNVGESANIVATVFEPTSIELDGGDRPVLFGYPRNAPLPDGSTAAGCRIGIPNYRSAPVSYTDTGWALFDSAINWGLNCPEINMPLPTAITTATVAPTSIATNIPTTAPTAPSTNTPVSTATSTPTSTPIPVVTEAPTATPNSTATPTNTPTATPTSTATSTPPEGDPIPALSVECRDITPPGVQRGEACIAGFVYVDGLPADGVIITVRDQNGVEIAAATTKVYSFPFGETRAYYRTVLSNVRPADSFTVEAEFNGQAVTSPAIVAATGVQQIDLVFSGDDDSRPVATIRRVDQLMIQGTDPLKAEGVGQSANANARIVAWRWVSDRDGLLGEAATLNRPIDGLAYGRHQLSLTVRDSNGVESVPVTTQIDVLNDNQIEWTVLLYLAGDYRDGGTLNRKFIKALRGIGQTLNTPSVRIAAYIDGPNPDDTVSYLIEPSQNGANIIDGPTRISEKAMDAPETLTEFINWGTTEFPSDHTYLVIADHGQVLRGIAWDHTSDLADDGKANLSQFLTVKEIASAIQNSVIQKVDILHFDACTMNLLEAAYELRNQAELMISSQYYGWDFFAYELYAELFNSLDTPHTIANRVIREYASLAKNGNQPFTISALDLGQIKPAMVALNNLSNRLANLLDQGDGQLESDLRTIRSAVQTFDSNENFINDLDDVYIDLIDWSRLVSDRTQNVEVKALSTELIDAVTGSESLVLGSESSSGHLPALGAEGTFVNLANANGLSIFYPTTANQRYVEYFSSESFAFADESGWRAYLEETEPLMLPPNEPVDPLPGPQQLLSQNQNIFLPVSFR